MQAEKRKKSRVQEKGKKIAKERVSEKIIFVHIFPSLHAVGCCWASPARSARYLDPWLEL